MKREFGLNQDELLACVKELPNIELKMRLGKYFLRLAEG